MIDVKNLCYTYNNKTHYSVNAVENINLSLNDGEILGIIGKTGSGKSTLVQMLSGLLSPTHGSISLNSKNINTDYKDMREVYFKIGMTFQYPETQLFEKTIFDDIAFGLRNKGITEDKIPEAVAKAAELTGLDLSLLDRSPLQLSGGEKRKCAIAGIIAMKPEVLILDEPTSGIDPEAKYSLLKSIVDYHKKEKNIIIFISHTMEEIAYICTKVLVMDKGKQVLFDTTKNVFKKYETLKSLGLDSPQTFKIISYIQKNKYLKNENIITPQEAQTKILNMLKSKGI